MVTIKNESTTIAAEKTVGEVIGLLTRRGVLSVNTEFTEAGKLAGLSFVMRTDYGPRMYKLPVHAEGVRRVLQANGAPPARRTPEHAAKVAWRIAKEWLEVQMALVDAGLARLDEVMMPYMLTDERTMYEVYRDNAMKALES